MKPFTTLFFLMLFSTNVSFAQTEDLNALLTQLAASIQQVEAKRYTYGQSLTWDKTHLSHLTYQASRTDTKGKSTSETFHFNLKYFDLNSIRRTNVKDVLTIQLNVDNKQKFIKTFYDGEQGKFINEWEIIATDADNALIIMNLLKEILPLVKKLPPTEVLPTTFESQLTWLEKNISDAQKNGKSIGQKIEKENGFNTRLVLAQNIEANKNTEQHIYKFNLIDLEKGKVDLEVKDKNIFIVLNTSAKYIHYTKNDELNNYTNELIIYLNDIETGQNITTVLQDLISKSLEQFKTSPQFTKASKLNESVQTAFDGKTTFSQKTQGDCFMTFESIYEEKGESTTFKTLFYLDDLDAKGVNIVVSKKTIWVKVKTEGAKKYLQNFKNETLLNYSNELEIRATNIENARIIKSDLEKEINHCEGKSACSIPDQDPKGLMKFVEGLLKNIDIGSANYEQELEPTNENPNQWKYSRTEKKEKKSETKTWVFNLRDLSADKISFEVSKKEIKIILPALQGEEIIKYYEDDKPDNYTKVFEFYTADIATARNLVCALQTAVKTCQQ